MKALAILLSGLTVRFGLSVFLLSLEGINGKAAPAAPATEAGALLFQDEFRDRLDPGWSFEREDPRHWRTTAAGLEVRVQPGNMWGGANNARNVLVRSIPIAAAEPIEISVTVSNRPSAQWEQANLVWFYDDSNMVKLGQELVTGRLSIVMGREEGDRARTVAIIPLDAYAVELRLQAVSNRVRGQFRTAPWREWRDAGVCDLPVHGAPKASLHFYNGRTNDEHWVKVNRFTVRQLPASAADWPRTRRIEKAIGSAENPRLTGADIPLPQGFQIVSRPGALAQDVQANYRQVIFLNGDGTYGWDWDRRSSSSREAMSLGVTLGKGSFRPVAAPDLSMLELEADSVTRLEDDHGDHNFAAVLSFHPAGRVAVWFDWYGPASETESVHDGQRSYGFMGKAESTGDFIYRIRGFRGAPPKVNLKPILLDALKRGLSPESQLAEVWFGNEVWNGSRGGTLVTRLDLVVNGERYASQPAKP